jgi:hypothetical protein
MNILNKLTPKSLILNAIKDKCEGSGITKIILHFNIIDDKYNVMFQKDDESSVKLDIEQNEINLIKKVFVVKIKKLYERAEPDKTIKAVILQFDLKETSLKIFIEDLKDIVTKFEY